MPPPTSQISRFTVRVIVTMDTLYLRRAVPRYTNSFLLCSSLKWIAVVLFSLTNQIPQTRWNQRIAFEYWRNCSMPELCNTRASTNSPIHFSTYCGISIFLRSCNIKLLYIYKYIYISCQCKIYQKYTNTQTFKMVAKHTFEISKNYVLLYSVLYQLYGLREGFVKDFI